MMNFGNRNSAMTLGAATGDPAATSRVEGYLRRVVLARRDEDLGG